MTLPLNTYSTLSGTDICFCFVLIMEWVLSILDVYQGKKEGNVLFNGTLNTFYLRLYGVRHMVKDHSDSERGPSCHHMGYSLQLTARVFYMHHPTDGIAHTTVFVTPVVEHWLEQEIAQWVQMYTKFTSCSCDFINIIE